MRIFWIIIWLALVWLYSCEGPGDCLTRTGKIVSRTQYSEPFHAVFLDEDINLKIVPDTSQLVVIRAGENLSPEICTEVINSTLYLHNNNQCKWSRSYKNEIEIEIHSKNISRIDYYGSDNIYTTDTLLAERFILVLENGTGHVDIQLESKNLLVYFPTGTAEILISGRCHFMELMQMGKGYVDSRSLITGKTKIFSKSTNNNYVNATDSLWIENYGPGMLYYSGDAVPVFSNERSQRFSKSL